MIEPDSVEESSIPVGASNSWYMIDCKDSDCYINFAGLSDDIRVSLYDLKGILSAPMRIPVFLMRCSEEENRMLMLLRKRPELPAYQTAFMSVSAGTASMDMEKDVDFTMIQSRECAYFDGTYMAVTGDDGQQGKAHGHGQ